MTGNINFQPLENSAANIVVNEVLGINPGDFKI